MTIRVVNTDFDRLDYDADGNVLYLAAGDPERVVGFEETQEGPRRPVRALRLPSVPFG
jgi:hypothetical protein